jgi:hypothetical protein
MIMVADFTGELRLELQLPRSAAKTGGKARAEFCFRGGRHCELCYISCSGDSLCRLALLDILLQ